MTRNEAALERAAADPGAVADAALRCEALADALRAWPFVGAGDMDRLEEPFYGRGRGGGRPGMGRP